MLKKHAILLSVLIGTCALGAIAGSVAWFVPVANLTVDNSPIDGVSEGAYFAYGDGTESRPFGIRKPRHLYNLAWLQYLGFFNEDKFNRGTKQYYFELAEDVRMGDMAIPPIGTEEYPFIGHFDGKNKIVSEFTTSNDFADFEKHPAIVQQSSFKNEEVKVVGFFGVVGNYKGAVAEGDYASKTNVIENMGLTDFTVRTIADKTLIGMAAGYVDANIDNVAVDVGTITIDNDSASAYDTNVTKRLSDHSLVGYTKNKKEVNRYSSSVYNLTTTVIPEAFVVDEESDTPGWGGSLDMVEMYDNLKSVWDNFTSSGNTAGGQNQEKYVSQRTIYKDRDGNEDLSRRVEEYTRLTDKFTDNGNYNYYGWEQKNNSDEVTSSYNFVIEPGATYSNESRYMCLSGERSVKLTGKTMTLTEHGYEAFVGHRVSYGNNYMSINSAGNLINQTEAANATPWIFDDTTGKFYTNDVINEKPIYLLCNSSGSLYTSASDSNEVVWSKYDGFFYATVGSNRFALDFDNSVWTTCNVEVACYSFKETSQNVYLQCYGGDDDYYMGTSSSEDNDTMWKRVGNNLESVAYPGVYICIYDTNYVVTSSDTSSYTPISFDGNTFKVNNSTSYLYYSDDYFYASTDDYYSGRLSIIESGFELGQNAVHANNLVYSNGTYQSGYLPKTTITTPTAVLETKPTYFPLKHENGVPKPENTGYLVSGANSHNSNPYGDIRVSKYAATERGSHRLKNSINTTTHNLKTVYTIDDSTTARSPTTLPTDVANEDAAINAKYPKYYKSLKRMNKALNSDTSNIYGLHFMDATIGGPNQDQRVNVGSAIINKSEPMKNYPLPTDCIDFNLVEKGAINFFAGTYFAGNSISGNPNDSFFSLYDIDRNETTHEITSLKEIIQIWKHKTDESAPYVYQYPNNQYSINSFNSSNYDIVFKTSWIKKQSSKGDGNYMLRYYSAYYFEIPMNEGEYCLGSVPNASGAYLMYLDIGANAQRLNRTIFGEKYSTVKKTYDYPEGVAIVDSVSMKKALAKEDGKSVDAKNSACVSAYAGYDGSYKMSRSGNQVSLDADTSATLKGSYAYDQVTFEDVNSAVECVARVSLDSTLSRTEYFDYDALRQETTRTYINHTVATAIDDFNAALDAYAVDEKSYLQQERSEEDDAAGVWNDKEESEWVVYRHEGADIGKAYASMDDVPMQDADALVLLEYAYATAQGVSAEETSTLIPVLDDENAKYDWSGINIDVKSSDTNKVVIEVKDPSDTGKVTITVVSNQDGSKTVTTRVVSANKSYQVLITPSVTSQQAG